MSMAHLPLTHLGLGPRGCSPYPLHEAPRGLAGLLSPDFESLRLGAVKPPSRSRPWLPLPPAGVTSTTKSQQHPPGPGWFSWVINPPWPPALQTTACERSVGGRSLALPPETLVLIRRSLSPCPGPPPPPSTDLLLRPHVECSLLKVTMTPLELGSVAGLAAPR